MQAFFWGGVGRLAIKSVVGRFFHMILSDLPETLNPRDPGNPKLKRENQNLIPKSLCEVSV